MVLELEHSSNAIFLRQRDETQNDKWKALLQQFAKAAISKTHEAYFISLGTSKDDDDYCNDIKDVKFFTFPTFALCKVDGAAFGTAAETAEFEDGYMLWLITKPKDDEQLKDWAEFFQDHHKKHFKGPFNDISGEIIALTDEGKTLIWFNPSLNDEKLLEIIESAGYQFKSINSSI